MWTAGQTTPGNSLLAAGWPFSAIFSLVSQWWNYSLPRITRRKRSPCQVVSWSALESFAIWVRIEKKNIYAGAFFYINWRSITWNLLLVYHKFLLISVELQTWPLVINIALNRIKFKFIFLSNSVYKTYGTIASKINNTPKGVRETAVTCSTL